MLTDIKNILTKVASDKVCKGNEKRREKERREGEESKVKRTGIKICELK